MAILPLSLLCFLLSLPSLSHGLWVNYTVAATTTPTPRLVQYVQTEHVNGGSATLSLLPLLEEGTGVTHIIFAMTHLNPVPGDIHLNDDPPNSTIYTQAWSDAKQLQAAEVKIMITMGGYGDVSYSRLASNFDAYYEPLRELITYYSLDGFDLDIEEDIDIPTVLRFINALYTDFGPDFVITMAPVATDLEYPSQDGYSGFPYADLDAQAVAADGTRLISFFNTQFYSGFGSPASTTTYNNIISAGWDPARVVMGILDASNDGSGYVPLAKVQSTISALRSAYPTFGGVDSWDYFDAGSDEGDAEPWQWVKSIGTALFRATAKRGEAVAQELDPEFPPSPFEDAAVAKLTKAGATHWQAVKALNRTGGNELKAWSLVNEILARNLK